MKVILAWETLKLQGINLKDTIQTEQLDLQKTFKQEKADGSNAMHNSNVTQIMTLGFTGELKSCNVTHSGL